MAEGGARVAAEEAEAAAAAAEVAALAGDVAVAGASGGDGDADATPANAPVVAPVSALEDAAARLQAAREANRKRAERFGTEYQEPNAHKILSRTEVRRLMEQEEEGFATGFDTTTAEEEERRRKRAERFQTKVFSYQDERDRIAGRTDEDREKLEAARARAKRFNIPCAEDVKVAEEAAKALVDDDVAPVISAIEKDKAAAGASAEEAKDGSVDASSPTLRKDTIHLRTAEYLTASQEDIQDYFSEFGASWIEWLNGKSVNVIFEDEFSAKRAFESLGEPIPKADGVPEISPVWRASVRKMVKKRTDRYGLAGAETSIFLRFATDRDTKERAKRTAGPRTMFGSRAGALAQRGGRRLRGGSNAGSAVAGRKRRRRRDDGSDGGGGGRGGAGSFFAASRSGGRRGRGRDEHHDSGSDSDGAGRRRGGRRAKKGRGKMSAGAAAALSANVGGDDDFFSSNAPDPEAAAFVDSLMAGGGGTASTGAVPAKPDESGGAAPADV